MRRRGRLAAIVAVAALAVGLGACGIPLDGAARPISNNALPKPLETPYSPPPRTTGTYHFPVFMFSLHTGHLVAVGRASSGRPTAQFVLQSLTSGPFESELTNGITTELSLARPPKLGLSVDSKTGVATVTLDDTFNTIIGVQLYEALAQIVYSLTEPGLGVTKVTFSFDGITYNYLPTGSFTQSPVTRANYKALAPIVPTS